MKYQVSADSKLDLDQIELNIKSKIEFLSFF